QSLTGISIQGALTQKWLFPFKSMQHGSGMPVRLPKRGFQFALYCVQGFRQSTTMPSSLRLV
ncbi:hypothetical protein BM607_021595, partial [Shewanella sp. SACH]